MDILHEQLLQGHKHAHGSAHNITNTSNQPANAPSKAWMSKTIFKKQHEGKSPRKTVNIRVTGEKTLPSGELQTSHPITSLHQLNDCPEWCSVTKKKPLSSKPSGWFSSCSYIWSTALLILLLYTSKVAYLLKRDGPQVWRGHLLSAPLLWRVCRSTWTFSPELSKQSFLKPHSNYQRNSRV